MPKLVDHATYSAPRRNAAGRARRATAEQVRAWRAFARAFSAARTAQEAALESSQLDPSEYDVLVTLAAGPPEGMRPSDLAERVLLTKSGMTRLLQRLEERGLIERRECPLDRRGQYVVMSAVGRRLLRRATPGLLRGLKAILSGLSVEDLAALERVAQHITEASTAHSTR